MSSRVAVCMTCNDTHVMPATGFMCTQCPVPCERCRQGAGEKGIGLGPYCATTPCPCECHTLGRVTRKAQRIAGPVEKGQRCQAPIDQCRDKAKAWAVFPDGKRALCYRHANELCARAPMTLGELRHYLSRMPTTYDHERVTVCVGKGDVRAVDTVAGPGFVSTNGGPWVLDEAAMIYVWGLVTHERCEP